MWMTMALVALAADPGRIDGDQFNARSQHFVVTNHSARYDARQIAEHCERWKAKLQTYWCGEPCEESWTPACEVVVHSGSASYLATVGRGASQTSGSSFINFAPVEGSSERRVSRRRIDLRGDGIDQTSALPHELTHIVLADLLGGRQPPRWADEGMAILADTFEKQMLHERDLNHGLASRQAFRMVDLLTMDSYPAPSRIPAFYGQSASLTAALAQRDEPAKFVLFLRRSLDAGYDRALREVYEIQSVSQLEQFWYQQRQTRRTGYHGVRLTLEDSEQTAEAGGQ